MPIPMHGADWYHLYEETPAEPKHTLKALVVQPGADGFDWRDAERLAERIANLPEARWVPVEAPGRLAPATWIDCGRPTVADHLDHVRLDEPTAAALDRAMASSLAAPLPRHQPLWRLTFVEGLENERVALVLALHHALADGTASARIIEAIVDGGRAAQRDLATDQSPETAPGLQGQAAHLARHHFSNLVGTPKLIGRSLASGSRVMRLRRSTGKTPHVRFDCPNTPFAVDLVEGRTYAQTEVRLDDLRRVKDVHGVTLNDVYMSVVGRAVHRHLAESGETPDAPLAVNVPVSVRPPDDLTLHGNFMRNWTVNVFSDDDDPVRRLHALHRETSYLRAERVVFDEQLLRDWFDRYGIMRHVSRTVVDVAAKRMGKTPMNFVASNVQGPKDTLRVCGSEVVGLRSASVLIPHHALNATAWSYRDTLSIGFTSCPGVIDDLAPLTTFVEDELAALVATI